jgi:hypothetical protein
MTAKWIVLAACSTLTGGVLAWFCLVIARFVREAGGWHEVVLAHWALQQRFRTSIVGVGLIVKEIVNDWRAARDIEEKADAPDAPHTVPVQAPGVTGTMGGLGMAPLIRGMYEADSFRAFIAARLRGGLRLRILGVLLFVAGATLEYVAALISAL